MTTELYTWIPEGDFAALYKDPMSVEMLDKAFRAIKSVDGGLQFMKTYSPDEDKGFMFSKPPPMLAKINEAISKSYDGHSGSSYGWTMRNMESIAKRGWDGYAKAVEAAIMATEPL